MNNVSKLIIGAIGLMVIVYGMNQLMTIIEILLPIGGKELGNAIAAVFSGTFLTMAACRK